MNLSVAVGYRREIIIGAINLTFNNFFGRRIAYSKPITQDDVVVCGAITISFLIAATLFNIVLIKIG